MEKEGKRRLPPIFKMSVLCNILPYYDYLDGWRRLLEKLNLKTNVIWEHNKDALIYLGRNFKREIYVTKTNYKEKQLLINSIQRDRLDLLSISFSCESLLYNFFDFSVIIDKIEEDKVLIFKTHTDIFKDYEIKFWSEESISSFLPAILCPSYKVRLKTFKRRNVNELLDCIKRNYLDSFVITKSGDEIFVRFIQSKNIKIFDLSEFWL